MKKTNFIMLTLAAGFIFTAVGLHAFAENPAKRAQRIVMATRAARLDAMRKLGERIKGLKIASTTTVADFVAENDEIATAMQTWLKGMKEETKPVVDEDGVVTLKMSITLKTVITKLKHFHKEYYRGDKIRIEDFNEITRYNKFDKIVVVGNGVMKPEEELEFVDPPVVASTGGVSRAKLPAFWKKNIHPRYRGQAKLMAQRAARVDAMRRLAERIKGLRISSTTYVKDFVAESDNINTDMRAFLRGAKELGVRYRRDELICEVEMQVTLKTVLTTFKSWADEHYKGDRVKLRQLQEYIQKVKFDNIIEVGSGVVNPKYCMPAQVEVQKGVAQIASQAPGWTMDTIVATGQGAVDANAANAAQAKLMALRAAELDARRKLAERINGLVIKSTTKVENFVAQKDEIKTKMLAYQQGATVIESSKVVVDGVATVKVELKLKPIWNIIIYYRQQGIPMP